MIWAKFTEGSKGEIDLAGELWPSLRDVNCFRNS